MSNFFTYSDGTQVWRQNGVVHRLDGPAVVYTDGRVCWYVDSIFYYTPKAYQEAAKLTDEEMSFILLKYKF